MAHRQRQLLHGGQDQELCQAIGTQASDHARDQPAKQRHGRELRENIEAGVRQTGREAGLANGDGTAAQMVR